MICAANFAALIYLNSVKNNDHSAIDKLQKEGKEIAPKQYYDIQIWSIICAISIIVSNEVGRFALSFFVNEESYPTVSQLLTEKVKVISVFKFINSAIVPMGASFFGVTNFEAQFTAGGLVDDISAVFVYYALIHQLFYLIDPLYLFKQCRKCCLFKVTQKSDGEVYLPKLTQSEAEQLFEGPKLDITMHVHDTVFVFWVAMFYMPLLPAGCFAALLAFYTNVMYVKLKLLTQHKKPPHID